MSDTKLWPMSGLSVPVFWRVGVICRDCGRTFRNEQGLAGHRYHRHGGRRHE
jgi:hypothetical protein